MNTTKPHSPTPPVSPGRSARKKEPLIPQNKSPQDLFTRKIEKIFTGTHNKTSVPHFSKEAFELFTSISERQASTFPPQKASYEFAVRYIERLQPLFPSISFLRNNPDASEEEKFKAATLAYQKIYSQIEPNSPLHPILTDLAQNGLHGTTIQEAQTFFRYLEFVPRKRSKSFITPEEKPPLDISPLSLAFYAQAEATFKTTDHFRISLSPPNNLQKLLDTHTNPLPLKTIFRLFQSLQASPNKSFRDDPNFAYELQAEIDNPHSCLLSLSFINSPNPRSTNDTLKALAWNFIEALKHEEKIPNTKIQYLAENGFDQELRLIAQHQERIENFKYFWFPMIALSCGIIIILSTALPLAILSDHNA